MSRIIFNIAAKTDAAGRPSSPNQDNCWVCPDLSRWNQPTDKIVGTDEDVELSEKGALLVVADGMGGMNAGEIASNLVIRGIQKKFSNIPDAILNNEVEIQNFIRDAIDESDVLIKKYAQAHREAEGLGSTIVLLWLLHGKAYCGWCGDSRIYRFNPNNELVRLSHDHSYVQSLVDEGKITEDEAFDHPDGNIISKALGDNGSKADPELRVYDVYQRDVFLLCSDGLCGLLQDSEINEVIQTTCTSSKDSLNALWEKGESLGWSDNATIDLLCVVEGGKPAKGRPDGYPVIARKPVEKKEQKKPQKVSGDNQPTPKNKSPYLYILAFVALCLLGFALYKACGSKTTDESTNHEYNIDTPDNQDDGNAVNNDNQPNDDQDANRQTGRTNDSRNSDEGKTNDGKPTGSSSQQSGSQNNSGNNNQSQSNPTNPNNNPGGKPNQGVIDQINQNNANQNDPQNSQPQEVYPSEGYKNMFNAIKNDYNNAVKAYNTVRQRGYRDSSSDNSVNHFLNNLGRNLNSLLSDRRNYEALSGNDKNLINSFRGFANELRSRYFGFRIGSSSRPGDGNSTGDDVYDNGQKL